MRKDTLAFAVLSVVGLLSAASVANAAAILDLKAVSVSGAGVTLSPDGKTVTIDKAVYTSGGTVTFDLYATVNGGTTNTGLISATGSFINSGTVVGQMGSVAFQGAWGGAGSSGGLSQLGAGFTSTDTIHSMTYVANSSSTILGDASNSANMVVFRAGGSVVAVTNAALGEVTFSISNLGAVGTSNLYFVPRDATGTSSSFASILWKESNTSKLATGTFVTAGTSFDTSGDAIALNVIDSGSVVPLPAASYAGMLGLGLVGYMIRRRKA